MKPRRQEKEKREKRKEKREAIREKYPDLLAPVLHIDVGNGWPAANHIAPLRGAKGGREGGTGWVKERPPSFLRFRGGKEGGSGVV